MPRILVIVPVAVSDEGLARRARQSAHVGGDGSLRLHYRPVKINGELFDSFHDYLIADLAVFEAGMRADAEGFDAVCVDTISDSGVNALRSVLDIPVVGPGRAAFLTALMLGDRFSVLTQWQGWAELYGRRTQEMGLRHKLVSVRALDVQPDLSALLDDKEDVVFPRLLEAGRLCIDDGADVICLGSTTMHRAAEYLAGRLDVPVVSPGPASYEFARSLLTLGLSQSRTAYPRAAVPKLEIFERMLSGDPTGDGEHGPAVA
ncbi:MAG: aspartate/glutamate racemase family protein [Solirubrobacteraceae bacterium]|nr:aspartate/glutamate racemase family protein [Solirubrobacteraceae bacterium]